jgi:hypothetical protein
MRMKIRLSSSSSSSSIGATTLGGFWPAYLIFIELSNLNKVRYTLVVCRYLLVECDNPQPIRKYRTFRETYWLYLKNRFCKLWVFFGYGVGVLVICVSVFIVFCIAFIVFFYCFVYIYLFLFVTSVRTTATE